jgi:ADP-heptose:LPS heptosyltransferase
VELKKIELVWRRLWMRALAAMLPGPSQGQLPPPDDTDYRVLVLRYERIGDMIMATSLIRNIARGLPGGKVDVLATPASAPVLELNPYVGRVLVLDRSSFRNYRMVMRQLRSERYTVMVDARINNPPVFTSTPLLMFVGRVPFRIGACEDKGPRVYNIMVPPWNRVDHYIDGSKQLAVPFGVDPARVDWRPEIFLSDEEISRADEKWREAGELIKKGHQEPGDSGKRLLINLSASDAKRRWPDGKFIATLQNARSRFPRIPMVVMGLPTDWPSVQKVASAVDALPVPTPKLRDALALVRTTDLVFTPDTSISHAASAFRKPALVLLKREHKAYVPYDTPAEIVVWDEEQIGQLQYERVAKALEKLLTEHGANRAEI